jgi:hypothetical protein
MYIKGILIAIIFLLLIMASLRFVKYIVKNDLLNKIVVEQAYISRMKKQQKMYAKNGQLQHGQMGNMGYGPQNMGYGQQNMGYGRQPPGYGRQPPGYGRQQPGYGRQPPGYGTQSSRYSRGLY